MISIENILASVRAHTIWGGMISRCTNKNVPHYTRYGGRGIEVCPAWMDFEVFVTDMGLPAPHLTLERIDNDGPYAPHNCKWATKLEQANNTHRSIKVTFDGVTLTLAQWARKLGIPRTTLVRRYRDGKSPADILTHVHAPTGIKQARKAMLAMRRAVTHCKHGHEFTAENTLIFKSGTRHCKECARTRAREFYRKKAGTKGRQLTSP